jgi:hypothetical protein
MFHADRADISVGRGHALWTTQITNHSTQPGIDVDQASQLAHPVLGKGHHQPAVAGGYDTVHVLDGQKIGPDIGQLHAVRAPILGAAMDRRIHRSSRLCRLRLRFSPDCGQPDQAAGLPHNSCGGFAAVITASRFQIDTMRRPLITVVYASRTTPCRPTRDTRNTHRR